MESQKINRLKVVLVENGKTGYLVPFDNFEELEKSTIELLRNPEKVKEFGKTAGEKFDFPGFELFHSFLERVHDRMAQIGDGAGKMKSGVIVAFEMMGEALEKCKFLKVMEALWTAVKVIAGGIADAVGTMMGTLVEKLGDADFSGVLDTVLVQS